jgi:hypothetical protein
LAGPRGLVVDGRALLVVNQNVNLDIPGEVLRYDATTLQFLDPPNSVLQQKRGGQPRCSVRTGRPGPRGGEFSDPLPA